MTTERKYYIGAGNIAVADLDANFVPTAFEDAGEVPRFELEETIEYADNYFTGKDGPNVMDLHAVIKRTLAGTMVIKEQTKRNLERLYHGESSIVAAGSVADEVLPEGLEAGDLYFLQNLPVDVETVVLTDSAGSPSTLTNGTHYRVRDSGQITFLDIDAADAVKATGNIHLASQPNADDTLVVGGKTYTFKVTPTLSTHIAIGDDIETTATNIAAKINTDTATTLCTADPAPADVALTANTAGTAGNSITLTVDGTRLTKTAFAGGDAADALVQPFHAAYDYGESTEVKIMNKTLANVCLIFDGDNLASSQGEHLYARLKNCSLGAPGTIALKSGSASGTGNTVNEYEIKFMGLIVPGETAADGYGVIKLY